jgi:hypothetical protein
MAALAVAVKLQAQPQSPFALAELGLGKLDRVLGARASPESGRIDLVDGEGRVVASSEAHALLEPLPAALWQPVKSRACSTTRSTASPWSPWASPTWSRRGRCAGSWGWWR